MARGINKLSAVAVSKLKDAGMYNDGGGLYLLVASSGSKSWIFRFKVDGKQHEMGLGAIHTVSLAEARLAALECRKLLLNGENPLTLKRNKIRQQKLQDARLMSFEQCAAQYIDAHRSAWKNAKHASQWTRTLEMFVYPVMGDIAAADIDTGIVLKAIEPIWQSKPETASRVRQRIEAILDWAKVRGYRDGENPARWKGHLDYTLPSHAKIAKTSHHAALPYAKISAFMQEIQKIDMMGAYALQFVMGLVNFRVNYVTLRYYES